MLYVRLAMGGPGFVIHMLTQYDDSQPLKLGLRY